MIEPKSRLKDIKPCTKEDAEWRLKLDENENIYGASKFAVSALRNFPAEQLAQYPKYKKYREKFGEIYNLDLNKIFFINNPDSAMGLIINTYLDVDDKIISNNPSYEKLTYYTLCAGGNIEFIEFGENFRADISKIREKLNSKVKICHLSTPNDMTGEVLRASIITEFLREFPETLFVVDISHIGFLDNIAFNDYTDMTDNYSNVIVIKSYANDYALAGLEAGVMVSDSRNIEALKILCPDYTVSSLSLNCAISAVKDTKYLEEMKQQNAIQAEILYTGLCELGFKPVKSEANFIFCDFGENCEFYYEKLKATGVITKKFSPDSVASNCLRITIPKSGGVKFLLKLLKPKDVLIFAFEDTLFDVRKSYYEALIRTFEHFAGHKTTTDKIKEAKRIKNCDFFNALYFLLSDDYIDTNIDEIKSVFKDNFHIPKNQDTDCLIDNDELIIKEEILQQLSLNFDMALVGLRPKEEIVYTLQKHNLDKYFSHINDTSSGEITKISEKLPHENIFFIVANEEILSSAKKAEIKSIGLIAKDNNNSDKINNLKHFGVDDIIFENISILYYFQAVV